ncbi:MAG: hypothetical protein WCT18_03580, partial [Patescibacteria group bacterium]
MTKKMVGAKLFLLLFFSNNGGFMEGIFSPETVFENTLNRLLAVRRKIKEMEKERIPIQQQKDRDYEKEIVWGQQKVNEQYLVKVLRFDINRTKIWKYFLEVKKSMARLTLRRTVYQLIKSPEGNIHFFKEEKYLINLTSVESTDFFRQLKISADQSLLNSHESILRFFLRVGLLNSKKSVIDSRG